MTLTCSAVHPRNIKLVASVCRYDMGVRFDIPVRFLSRAKWLEIETPDHGLRILTPLRARQGNSGPTGYFAARRLMMRSASPVRYITRSTPWRTVLCLYRPSRTVLV